MTSVHEYYRRKLYTKYRTDKPSSTHIKGDLKALFLVLVLDISALVISVGAMVLPLAISSSMVWLPVFICSIISLKFILKQIMILNWALEHPEYLSE